MSRFGNIADLIPPALAHIQTYAYEGMQLMRPAAAYVFVHRDVMLLVCGIAILFGYMACYVADIVKVFGFVGLAVSLAMRLPQVSTQFDNDPYVRYFHHNTE